MTRERWLAGCLGFCVLLASTSALAGAWPITQITTSGFDKRNLVVDGSMVAWTEQPSLGSDTDVFVYEGAGITWLTDDTLNDEGLHAAGGTLAWAKGFGTYNEIMTYRGGTITTITDNGSITSYPETSGTYVTWTSNNDLYVYDGTTVRNVTDDSTTDMHASISGSTVVWSRSGPSNYEIHSYDVETSAILKLTDMTRWCFRPHASGLNVVWAAQQRSGSWPDDLFYRDAGGGVTQLTYHSGPDSALEASISGKRVVWVGTDGNDEEAFCFDADTGIVTNLTDNDTNTEYYVAIDGDLVVYNSPDAAGHDDEIFLYNAATGVTMQLTDNDYHDRMPRISGNTVAWIGDTGTYAQEVFMTVVPEPATLALVAVGLAAVLARRRG